VDRVRRERKKQLADRHARVMASPANPVEINDDIEEADYRPEPSPKPKKLQPPDMTLWSPPASYNPSGETSIVLRMNGRDVVLTTDPDKVARTLQDLIR